MREQAAGNVYEGGVRMSTATKTPVTASLAAVITGVMLVGTTGLTFACGWALCALGLVVVLAAVPPGGPGRRASALVYAARSWCAVSASAQRAWPVVKSVRMPRPSES